MRSALAFGIVIGVLLVPHVSAWNDPQAPADVVALRAPNGDTVIAWTPTTTASNYIVYRHTASGYEKIYQGSATATVDFFAPPDATLYLVSAVTMDGQEHSTPATAQSGGDCIGISMTPAVYYSVPDCLAQLPEL